MIHNKFLNLGYLSFISVIFGIGMSVSFVKAASSSQSKAILAQSVPELFKLATGETEEDLDIVTLFIKGMTCANCEDAVKAGLMKCDGVKDARVSHKDGKAIINVNIFEFGVDEIIEAVKKAGFSATIGH
jgi:copper chaperone CopZ